MKPAIQDIVKLAGLKISAVSRALTGMAKNARIGDEIVFRVPYAVGNRG